LYNSLKQIRITTAHYQICNFPRHGTQMTQRNLLHRFVFTVCILLLLLSRPTTQVVPTVAEKGGNGRVLARQTLTPDILIGNAYVELRSRLTLLLPISKEWCQLAHMIWADTANRTREKNKGTNKKPIKRINHLLATNERVIRVHIADLRSITGEKSERTERRAYRSAGQSSALVMDLPSDKFSGCSCSPHDVMTAGAAASDGGGTMDVGDVFRFRISSMHNLDRFGGGGCASWGGLTSTGFRSSLIKAADFLLKSFGAHNIDAGDSGESGSSNIDSSSKSDSSDCGDFFPFGDSEFLLPPFRLLRFLAAAARSRCRLFLNQLPTWVGVRPVA